MKINSVIPSVLLRRLHSNSSNSNFLQDIDSALQVVLENNAASDDILLTLVKKHPFRFLQALVAIYMFVSMMFVKHSKSSGLVKSLRNHLILAGIVFYLFDIIASIPEMKMESGSLDHVKAQVNSFLSHSSTLNLHFVLLAWVLRFENSGIRSSLISIPIYLLSYLELSASFFFPVYLKKYLLKKSKGKRSAIEDNSDEKNMRKTIDYCTPPILHLFSEIMSIANSVFQINSVLLFYLQLLFSIKTPEAAFLGLVKFILSSNFLHFKMHPILSFLNEFPSFKSKKQSKIRKKKKNIAKKNKDKASVTPSS